jgi:trehalose 6-phosphate phosphatase
VTLQQQLDGAAADAWRQLIDDPETALLAFDFDGTLSPITEDPAAAYAPPEVAAVLARLGPRVGQLAVVTGRPVQAVRRLGGFEGVDGLSNLVVLGQYGYERWDAATGRVVVPPPPEAIQHIRAELPAVLSEQGWADAHVEEKGRALGVHLRRLPDPDAAFRALLGPLTALAERHGLTVEPGKHVIEIRDDGMNKGIALFDLVAEVGARTVLFAGDDLGDMPAFDMVAAMRQDGVAGLTICSQSGERTELADHTDLSVCGPAGVVELLSRLADELAV